MDIPLSRESFWERTPFRHVDPGLLGAVVALTLFGLMMVYSATHRTLAQLGHDPGRDLKKQVAFLILGLVAMVVAAVLDYRILRLYVPFFYLGCIGLLILVRTPLGSSALGAQRWFQVAGFQFSPSLFTRLGLVLMLALYLSNVKGEITLRTVIRATLIGLVPMVLVFLQPDIGTTIILATIIVAMLVAAGTRTRFLVVLALTAALALFGAFQLHIVKDYQVARLTNFLHASNDQTQNYNRREAEIAVGAGGVLGKGYLKGSQTDLAFVPEQYTDFIFTVVGEETGFLGAVMLLILFAFVLWRAYRIALLSRDPFGTYLAVGIATMIAIQVFVNIGMTLGIMPITGIPLPFISYGGSALVADFIGIGLLQNVHMRRSL
jgi:rod shape determining protein RodA